MVNNFNNVDEYVKRSEISGAVIAGSLAISGASAFTGIYSHADYTTGGSIGTAAATVDGNTIIKIAQTTAAQTLTLPSPTVTTAGKVILVVSDSTAGFTIGGTVLTAHNGTQAKAWFVWDGSAWV